MEVTEKCDVYSFGMVALEVLLGTHPGVFISFISSTFTPSSSTVHAHHILLRDVLDQRLSPPTRQYAEEVVFIMKLALSCLQSRPQSRPTMRLVSQQLSSQKPHLVKPFHMISLGHLF